MTELTLFKITNELQYLRLICYRELRSYSQWSARRRLFTRPPASIGSTTWHLYLGERPYMLHDIEIFMGQEDIAHVDSSTTCKHPTYNKLTA